MNENVEALLTMIKDLELGLKEDEKQVSRRVNPVEEALSMLIPIHIETMGLMQRMLEVLSKELE